MMKNLKFSKKPNFTQSENSKGSCGSLCEREISRVNFREKEVVGQVKREGMDFILI